MTGGNKDCHSGKVKTAPIRIVHQSFRIVHQCEYQRRIGVETCFMFEVF